MLTWSGPSTAPASGNVTLHFGVTASNTPGTYFNNAGAEAASFAVAPTGDTAPVTVTGDGAAPPRRLRCPARPPRRPLLRGSTTTTTSSPDSSATTTTVVGGTVTTAPKGTLARTGSTPGGTLWLALLGVVVVAMLLTRPGDGRIGGDRRRRSRLIP